MSERFFLKRKRGTPQQIGQTFPVNESKIQKFRDAPLQVFTQIRQTRGRIHLQAVPQERVELHIFGLDAPHTEEHLLEIHGLTPREVESAKAYYGVEVGKDALQKRHQIDHEEYYLK